MTNSVDNSWSLPLVQKFTFENFVVGSNSRFVYASALAVAKEPGKAYNPFFIYGPVGLGKTHIMHAIGHSVLKSNAPFSYLCTTAEKFMSHVIDSIRHSNQHEFREKCSSVDLLMIDDVQFLSESESTQDEFFHVFNMLYQNGKQIVLTSDRPPKQLVSLTDRVRNRFEWGLIADIKFPDLETRVAILKNKAEQEKMNIDEKLLLFVASKLKSSVRELEGFLKRLKAYAAFVEQPIALDLVKLVIGDLLPPETDAPQSVLVREDENVHLAPSRTEEKEELIVITQAPAVQPQEQPKSKDTMLATSVDVGVFYPEGRELELSGVKERFAAVLRKHRLKFNLKSSFESSYSLKLPVDYSLFPRTCRSHGVNIVIVIGPPPGTLPQQEFANSLITLLESEQISLQYISWGELTKDYRYLNMALDMTIARHK